MTTRHCHTCWSARLALIVLTLAATAAAPVPDYHVVPDWPKLPPGYRLGQTTAAAADGHGLIYVFHRGEHPVMVFDRAGNFVRSWGDGLTNKAHGLRIDPEGNVWTTDVGSHTVRKFTPDGKLLLTLGKPDQPGNNAEQFDKPTDIAFTPEGDFYVSDGYGNSRVVKFSREGKLLVTWGTKGTKPGQFNLPHAVVLDRQGRVYIGDRENNRIQIFDSRGRFLSEWTHFGAPFGLFLVNDDRFFVADGRAHKVLILDNQGRVLSSFGSQGKAPGQLDLPHMLTVDTDGAVYVTEITGQRVQKFIPK